MTNIPKGKILETTQGGRFAKVETIGGQIISNVLLIFPHNSMSRPNIGDDDTDTNLVLLLQSINEDNYFGLPYNVLLQPELEIGEYINGNLNKGNTIFFDKDGNITITSPSGNSIKINEGGKTEIFNNSGNIEILGSNNVSVDGQDLDLGDATAAILNTSATMTVDTTTSNPAQPVVIVTSGQTADKVKV